MTIRSLLTAVVLSVFCPAAAMAQAERGEIRLQVTDATGLPLRAGGTLSGEAPQLYRSFVTDDAGRFALQDLPFGVYRLIVEQPGFAPYSAVVDLHSAVPKTLQVEMALASLSATVQVTDDRPLVDGGRTGVMFSIGAPQIQEKLAAVPGRRLLDLVDTQPGWLMEANGVLHPRGSEYQTLLVVDGVPMDENRSPAFAPDVQDGDLQAVHVMTGNFPAEYGRKLGGVIEVSTTRDIQQGLHGSAGLGGGSFGTAMGDFSGTYGRGGRALSVSGSMARTDRYLDPPVPDNFTNHGSLDGIGASYEQQISDAGRIRLTGHRRNTTFLVPNEILQQDAGQRQARQGHDDLGQLAWTRIIGTRLAFDTRGVVERLSATLDSNPLSTPIIVSQDRWFTRIYANASVAADLGHQQVKVGGDAEWAPVREQLSYRITDPSFFDPATPLAFDFADRAHDREQSLFAQDTIAMGAVTASVGLRWDRYAFVVNDQAFSPRLGVAWSTAGDHLVVRASYDRVLQTPAMENLLLASSPAVDVLGPVARAPIEPSRGHFVEAGVTAGLAGRARLDVTAYRRTFSPFADDDVFLNTGISFPVAFDRAHIGGVDAKLTVLPWRRVSGFASYALLKGTATLPVVGGLFLGEEALASLAGRGDVVITQDQRHTVRGQIRVAPADRIWVAVSLRYGSGLPIEIDGEPGRDDLAAQFGEKTLAHVDLTKGRVKPNLAIDAGLGVHLWESGRRRIDFRLELANLTNRFNVINFAGLFSGTALAPPRSATGRLQVEF